MTKPGKICSIQDNAYGPSNIGTEVDINDNHESGKILVE